MKKRINANLYTETRIIWKEHTMIGNADGTLFSNRHYKTKILPSDLPEWFVEGSYYKNQGYLSSKGVKYLLYDPNLHTNHMFKDDFLYISYDRPITTIDGERSVFKFEGFDEYIWGWNIVNFLKAAEQYSSYDIKGIKEQIKKKRQWFKATFPEFYDLECSTSSIF